MINPANFRTAVIVSGQILFVLLTSSCSSQSNLSGSAIPGWADNPSQYYNESQHLMAVGSGSTLNEAQENALGNLSRIFQAKIHTSRELIDDFVETSIDDEHSTQRTTQLLNITRVGSRQDLINTRILESDLAANGTYYALAGMDRRETVRIYEQEISSNDLKIDDYETNADQEADLLQRLVLLKKALVLAEVNENLSRQKNILLGGASDRELNTRTLNRLRERYRLVKQQVPVTITSTSASPTIVSAVAGILQQSGFNTESSGHEPVLEVKINYQSREAELKREKTEFVKWELIIEVVNQQTGQSLKSFFAEGRDGALSYSDALKRADSSARKIIASGFKAFLNRELLALK